MKRLSANSHRIEMKQRVESTVNWMRRVFLDRPKAAREFLKPGPETEILYEQNGLELRPNLLARRGGARKTSAGTAATEKPSQGGRRTKDAANQSLANIANFARRV